MPVNTKAQLIVPGQLLIVQELLFFFQLLFFSDTSPSSNKPLSICLAIPGTALIIALFLWSHDGQVLYRVVCKAYFLFLIWVTKVRLELFIIQ